MKLTKAKSSKRMKRMGGKSSRSTGLAHKDTAKSRMSANTRQRAKSGKLAPSRPSRPQQPQQP